jgi:serine/threonine protein kinase
MGKIIGLSKGDRILDKYTVVANLDNGAGGIVYSVVDDNGNKYACKLYYAGSHYTKYMENELRVLRRLQGASHVIRLVDAGAVLIEKKKDATISVNGCTIMDLMGCSLRDVLAATDCGIALSTVKHIFRQILTGVAEIHARGVIHSDLCVSNIMLTRPNKEINGDDDIQVVIVDFDSSNFVDKYYSKQVGRRQYISPEQMFALDFGVETDIWALGCVFWELLTGYYLFDFDDGEDDDEGSHTDEEASDRVSISDECPSVEGGKDETSSTISSINSYSSDFNEENNYEHLRMIYELLGKPPKTVVDGGRQYYNGKGKMKHNPEIMPVSLTKLLIEDFEYEPEIARDINEFIMCMLAYRPEDRKSAAELLEHPFMK